MQRKSLRKKKSLIQTRRRSPKYESKTRVLVECLAYYEEGMKKEALRLATKHCLKKTPFLKVHRIRGFQLVKGSHLLNSPKYYGRFWLVGMGTLLTQRPYLDIAKTEKEAKWMIEVWKANKVVAGFRKLKSQVYAVKSKNIPMIHAMTLMRFSRFCVRHWST